MNTKFSLKYISELISGQKIINCDDPENLWIESVSTLSQSKTNSISFISNRLNLRESKKSNSIAYIINFELYEKFTKPAIVVENAELSIIEVLNRFYPPRKSTGTIAKTAIIHPTVQLGKNVEIGEYAIIEENSTIGDNTIIMSNAYIGKNVNIGEDSKIGIGTIIYDEIKIGKRFISLGNTTIGADGFKLVQVKEKFIRVPQIGTVIIGDDVEVGANCTIDRGGLQDTIIGDGCKFDKQVHIAHNCILGKNVVVAGQSGVAGSAVLGDNVLVGGACAISDHLTIPAGTILAGGSAFRTSPKERELYVGWDINLPYGEFQKFRQNIKYLPTLNQQIEKIEYLAQKLDTQSNQKEE